MPPSQLQSSRYGSLVRKGLSIAVLVLAGPIIVQLLLANISFLRVGRAGGTCVFDLNLFFATGNSGLIVYWVGPWFVLGAIIGATSSRLRGQACAICLRWLAAPGFGLLCALIFSLQASVPLLSGNSHIALTYAPISLPFILFLLTYQPRLRSILDDPKWFGVIAGAIMASYVATWALVRPHVLNYLSCGVGG
jgi:hypothetical protein